jgi:hypothetical protein
MVDLNGKLGLHADFRCEVVHIGAERSPVLVVDNFLGNPQLLVDYAASLSVFLPSSASYPGLRASIPPIYSFALQAFLNKIVCQTFSLPSEEVLGGTCGYALVTTPPQELQLVQRMPHFDAANRKQIALLHYLCPAEKGGTSFYRHRRTGFEVIDEGRLAGYTSAVEAELKSLGPPPSRYIVDDDAMFERIASFEAAYNRVLIYRSANLHSASIRPGFHFDSNPRTGRLTANAIFIYR